uniref:Uncharacterized protein n=1 Tax=viral metagenome TaxID=1070528 RepID=A0A6M3LD04_9ZZZZ
MLIEGFTKGEEWKAKRRGIITPATSRLDFRWCVKCNKRTIVLVDKESNAHLIAAAPRMYRLLKEIRNADLEMSQAIEALIEIVLSQAEGREENNGT